MNLKQSLAISLITLASSAAMADGDDIGVANYPVTTLSSVSRASVKADVIAARANGELPVAGEAGDTPYAFLHTTPSTLSREDVKVATLAAAKAGQLIPAGPGPSERPTGEFAGRTVAGSGSSLFASIENKLRSPT